MKEFLAFIKVTIHALVISITCVLISIDWLASFQRWTNLIGFSEFHIVHFLQLLAGLSLTDKSHFAGNQKLWILQHVLIPRTQWPLLIYEIPISLAFKLGQKVCLHSQVVASPSLNIKSLFVFFSISMSIAYKQPIISAKSFKN